MSIFEWDNSYLTGVAQIDEDHRHLVDLLNKTYTNFINYASLEELRSLFDELIDYATYHFFTEERLMQEWKYPKLASQKQAHDEFIRRVLEMHTDYHQGKKILFLEILSFLQTWLATHIRQSDAELGRFLTSESMSKLSDPGRTNVNA